MRWRPGACGLLVVTALACAAQDWSERKFAEIVGQTLDVRAGSFVADIGTGDESIAHLLPIAEKAGPRGKLVCVDVTKAIVAEIAKQIKTHHVTNMEAVLGTDSDPKLTPGTFDSILVSNTYHEFVRPSLMLEHIHDALKPGGRLLIGENYTVALKDEPRADQVKRHDIAPALLERELVAAGFVITKRMEPIQMEPGRFRYHLVAERSK